MKRLLRIAVLISMASSGALYAAVSEFRSPRLRAVQWGVINPFSDVEDAFWYDDMPEGREETRCKVTAWGSYYQLAAHRSFSPFDGKCTSDTDSLSTLWFGKEAFRGEEIFANGMITDCAQLAKNPFLGFARISPRFDYNERGVIAGVQYRHDFGENERWHTGFRVSLPVKEIEIEQNAGNKLEETLDDVVKRVPTSLDPNADANQVDYAFRLDLVSALCRQSVTITNNDTPTLVPLIQYGDGTEATSGITYIGGRQVNAANAAGDIGAGVPAAYVVRSDRIGQATSSFESTGANSCDCDCIDIFECGNVCASGQIPAQPFRKSSDDVNGPLAADGSGGSDGSVLFFQSGLNYAAGLATDRNAQGKLFVVPRRQTDEDTIIASSVGIEQALQSILQYLDPSETASEFFCQNGIDFNAHERVVGVGDLDFEWNIGYGHYDDWFIDYLVGVRFPTGTKPKSAKRIYHKPTGNNRHFEIKLGLEGGWHPCDWFAFRVDLAYNHAFKRSECRAAPFCKNPSATNSTGCNTGCDSCKDDCKKACQECCNSNCNTSACEKLLVKNIGPNLDVDVSWHYFVGHLDFTILHPHNPDLGMVLGYQLMAKSDDDIDLDCDNSCNTGSSNTATDLLGRPDQALDLSILECNTNSRTHKIYGHIFHRWNYFELFGGASHVVAGRHAMQETEAHLGMKIFF